MKRLNKISSKLAYQNGFEKEAKILGDFFDVDYRTIELTKEDYLVIPDFDSYPNIFEISTIDDFCDINGDASLADSFDNDFLNKLNLDNDYDWKGFIDYVKSHGGEQVMSEDYYYKIYIDGNYVISQFEY